MENILSIELNRMNIDSSKPDNVLVIRTKRSNYIFRLSEAFSFDKQAEIFRTMVIDLQTDDEPVIKKDEEKPDVVDATPALEEKHDGARLFDEPPSAPTDVEITVKPVATQD